MKDNQLDLGSVKVHRKAIAEIIALTISEMEGVSLVERGPLGKVLEYFPREDLYGVDVRLDENASISVGINTIVRYGLNIPDIAREIQDAVKAAIRQSLNIDLSSVNIYIRGIERGKS